MTPQEVERWLGTEQSRQAVEQVGPPPGAWIWISVGCRIWRHDPH